MTSALHRRQLLTGLTAAAFAPEALARPARFPRPDRELMAPVPGGRVYVRVNGRLRGRRAPLLMIHGGPGGTHSGFLDALELTDDRAIILYDQLDGGRSDRPNDPANWTVPRFTDEVEAIRAALGVERWYVYGQSWGGTVGLEYGVRQPPALAGLVLSSPLISTRSWIADANYLRAQMPPEVQDALNDCDVTPPPTVDRCDAATTQFYARYVRREPVSEVSMAYRETMPRTPSPTYQAMWGRTEFVSTGTLRDYDGEPLLTRLNGPRTLFIAGQHDEARPETIGRFAAVAGAEFAVVPGAAHATLGDRPNETNALLRAWLRRMDETV